MPTDPALYALYQENLRLRELLTRVAEDLERLAAQEESERRWEPVATLPPMDSVTPGRASTWREEHP